MSEVVYKRYGDVSKAIDKGSIEGLIEVGQNVANQAKVLAPVDTGRLEGSIYSKKLDEETVVVGTATEYAGYQEFGTRKMPAQPFLRPAIDIEARGANAQAVMAKYQNKAVTEAVMRGAKFVKL